MGNEPQAQAIRESMVRISSLVPRTVSGLDRYALDASLNGLRREIATLARQNAELAEEANAARRAAAEATEAKAAAESRETACHQLIEDLVRHFHRRDRRVADVMAADPEYSGLLSRASRIEQARHNSAGMGSDVTRQVQRRSA